MGMAQALVEWAALMDETSAGGQRVLRAPAAAELLGMDPKALRRQLRAGLIPGYQIGATWFVYMDVIGVTQKQGASHQANMVAAEIGADRAQGTSLPDAPIVDALGTSPAPTGYEALAVWTPWIPFDEAVRSIPRLPGVYIAREESGAVVYVGMAAERSGNGMRGRLAMYATGRAGSSGLGEGALDRALADAEWMKARLLEAESGHALSSKELAKAAIQRAGLEVRWAVTPSGPDASALETRVIQSLAESKLWNKRR